MLSSQMLCASCTRSAPAPLALRSALCHTAPSSCPHLAAAKYVLYVQPSEGPGEGQSGWALVKGSLDGLCMHCHQWHRFCKCWCMGMTGMYYSTAKWPESTFVDCHVMLQGTLRVLLVLLHDFPEFLCEYHFQLCNVIPPSCIQMRNLILSAFPRNMRLPDPFTPNLKVDLLPEINQSPKFVPEPQNLLPAELRYTCTSALHV